jgi:hypothetical protein
MVQLTATGCRRNIDFRACDSPRRRPAFAGARTRIRRAATMEMIFARAAGSAVSP